MPPASDLPKKTTGYFDTIGQLVASQGGQNMIGFVKGVTNAVGGVFLFVTDNSLVADANDIFAATGSSEPSSFWVRQKGESGAYAPGFPRMVASWRHNFNSGAGNISNAVNAVFATNVGTGNQTVDIATAIPDNRMSLIVTPVNNGANFVNARADFISVGSGTTRVAIKMSQEGAGAYNGICDVQVWQTQP